MSIISNIENIPNNNNDIYNHIIQTIPLRINRRIRERTGPQQAEIHENFLNNRVIANNINELEAYANDPQYRNRIVYLRNIDPNNNTVGVYRITCNARFLGEISGIPGEGTGNKRKVARSTQNKHASREKTTTPNEKCRYVQNFTDKFT